MPELRDSTDRIQRPLFANDLEDRPTLRRSQFRLGGLRPVEAVALDALMGGNEPAHIVVAPTSNSTVMITSKATANHSDVSAAFSTIVEDDERPIAVKPTRPAVIVGAGMLQAQSTGHAKLIVMLVAILAIAGAFLALR